jgi:hypothetical protein
MAEINDMNCSTLNATESLKKETRRGRRKNNADYNYALTPMLPVSSVILAKIIPHI